MSSKFKIYKLSVFFIIICCVLDSFGQTLSENVPSPDVWWSFDKSKAGVGITKESYKPTKVNGITSPETTYTTNRFGVANSAIAFSENGHISIPKINNNFNQTFFGLGYVPKDVTISCWVKIDHTKTEEQKIFFGDNMFGLFKKDNTLVVRRNTGWASIKKPWNYSLSEPKTIMNKSGWYYVSMVYGEFYFRVFIASNTDTNLTCSFNYLGSYKQNWQDIEEYIIGNKSGKAIEAIDDFRIWSQLLTPEQIDANFRSEKINNIESVLPASSAISLVSGNYYMVDGKGKCMFQDSRGALKWQAYKDGDNKPKWELCSKVEVADERIAGDDTTQYNRSIKIKGKSSYIAIDPLHFQVTTLSGSTDVKVSNHNLYALQTKAIIKPYQIGVAPPNGMPLSLALTENGLGSFSYQFINVNGTTSSSSSNSASSAVSSTLSPGAIAGIAVGVTVLTTVTTGAVIYKLKTKPSSGYERVLKNEESIDMDMLKKCN